MAHNYCECGGNKGSCIDCAEEEIDRLTAQLAEARAEINRRDEFCGKCENDQLVSLEQAHRAGREQAKTEASGLVLRLCGSGRNIADAIAAMEYSHKEG